ncbi:MAG: RyR domain-containing protein [Christensenellales bacterium]
MEIFDVCKQFFDNLEFDTMQTPEQQTSDKLCFENALNQFLVSGKKEDAFTVYYCFSEIFKLFGQGYDNTKRLLEMLSDHEYHSGELLSKHRDHYSHSVYVFSLGLAIYSNDGFFRKNYLEFYNLEDTGKSAFNFLKHWGIVALFHDIGYPFQLAHEQIKTYSEEVWGKGNSINPFVSYGNMDNFLMLDQETQAKINETFHPQNPIGDLNALLAYGLKLREGYDEKSVCAKLYKRVVEQPLFMDHGYFSAVILAKQLLNTNTELDISRLDDLTAILLHNSFNKFDAPDKHPIELSEHPLAYLLILCDELQCWDRHAYGKISKRDPLPYEISFIISDNYMYITYYFDSFFVRTEDEQGKPNVIFNKNYKEMSDGIFTKRIFAYVVSPLKLEIAMKEKAKPRKSKLYVSDDSFINLCDFAKAVHISYDKHCKSYSNEHIETDFSNLPLEFKVSNIEQAKSYAEKLELINCFYSSKDLDYPVVTDFNRTQFSSFTDNLGFLSREEHVRWVKEKLAMGWKYGTDYDKNDKEERNRKKIHSSIVPFEMLSEEDRSKDKLMINNIIPILRKFDSNIKIYNYRFGRKPNLEIAGTGHRFIKGSSEVIQEYKNQIKEILKNYSKDYRVVVRSCFAYGADQLIAECATELGITVKADLPMEYEDYIADVRNDVNINGYTFTQEDELRMRHLLAQTVVCKAITDRENTYAASSQYLIDNCSKLIVLWDGKETPLYDKDHRPINRGGTYDTLRMAREAKKFSENDIHIIYCER